VTDGLYLDVTTTIGPLQGVFPLSEQLHIDPQAPATPILDLSTFDLWIAIQPVEASIDLLYRIAEDLAANKGWSGVAYKVRQEADDLRTLTRHGRP